MNAPALLFALVGALNRVMPKDPAAVVVHGLPDLEDGTLAVLEELIGRGWSPIVLVNDPAKADRYRERFGGRVKLVPKRSPRALLHFLRARLVFMTHGMYGSRTPPPGQTVVNLWHGEPAGKSVARYDGRTPVRSSFAPVLSTVGQAYRSAEFALHPSQVPVVGAPRNDRLLGTDRAAVRAALLGGASDRRLFLWLPTYRESIMGLTRVDVENAHPGVPFDAATVRRIDEWLDRHDATVIVKPHPLAGGGLEGPFKAIRVCSQEQLEERGLSLYNLLPAADCLITDVSSVWIDYLLLDRPMILAFPDIDEYRRTRGINLEPYEAWVPAPFARTVDELLEHMLTVVEGRDAAAESRRHVLKLLHRFRDDRSTRRLFDAVGVPESAPPART